jgi:MoaA/NifB/PqqE/SkfB family radical SAM enzyme
MNIREKLLSTKINTVQLDPFGFCNAKCWFCPVKYKPQPEIGLQAMSVELLEKIIIDISNERKKKDGVISPSMNLITSAHYNEILLYKHLKKFLQLLRENHFKTHILSNGVSLTKEKVDLIWTYRDVVEVVGLNIPAFEKDVWASRSGFSPEQFDRLMDNLKYAEEKLVSKKFNIQIHVNGIDEEVFRGFAVKGDGFDDLQMNLDVNNGEHKTQFLKAKELFPKWNINRATLFDRAGSIDIFSNQESIKAKANNNPVTGCDFWRGNRSTEWLHINSAGQTFLCCNDYNFDYVFGDLSKQNLSEVWGSDDHIDMLKRAYGEICTKCLFATYN